MRSTTAPGLGGVTASDCAASCVVSSMLRFWVYCRVVGIAIGQGWYFAMRDARLFRGSMCLYLLAYGSAPRVVTCLLRFFSLFGVAVSYDATH